jgi:CHAT domain-containing protein
MRLAAEWIILSACNTAAGDGPGLATYSGLARAFHLAGARSLLLSHWPVRDDAAARLSVATVTAAAAGMERSEALRQAQLALIAARDLPGAASPAIWAPFVLIE